MIPKLIRCAAVWLMWAALHAGSLEARVYYVNILAVGTKTGLSWQDAFTDLQDALAKCADGDEIWISAGIYRPTSTDDPSVSFNISKAISIYGGFSGMENSLDRRNWLTNQTVLSGDIGVAENSDDNVKSICVIESQAPCRLDGLVFRDGGNASDGEGGAIFQPAKFPYDVSVAEQGNIIANCTFTSNHSHFSGGAINVVHGNMLIANCNFDGNSSGLNGGAIALGGSEPVKITKSRFLENNAGSGGAIFGNGGGAFGLESCTFVRNHAAGSGGAMGSFKLGPNAQAINCLFESNDAGQDGGAISWSNLSVVNCTVARNTAFLGSGGGAAGPLTAVNSIFWENLAVAEEQISGAANVVIFCDVQGGFPGTGNIALDPRFVAPESGDFHLAAGSPAIDRGENSAVEGVIPKDLDGNARIANGSGGKAAVVDLGAYEYNKAIQITLVKSDTSGSITLRIFAPIGHSYTVERSDSLQGWTALGLATQGNGFLEFVDGAPPSRRAFYRARVL